MALPGLFLACFGGSIELIDLLLRRRPELWDRWYKERVEYWRAKAEPARECQLRYDSGESLWAATLRASGAFATANPSAHDEDVLKARTEAGAYAAA